MSYRDYKKIFGKILAGFISIFVSISLVFAFQEDKVVYYLNGNIAFYISAPNIIRFSELFEELIHDIKLEYEEKRLKIRSGVPVEIKIPRKILQIIPQKMQRIQQNLTSIENLVNFANLMISSAVLTKCHYDKLHKKLGLALWLPNFAGLTVLTSYSTTEVIFKNDDEIIVYDDSIEEKEIKLKKELFYLLHLSLSDLVDCNRVRIAGLKELSDNLERFGDCYLDLFNDHFTSINDSKTPYNEKYLEYAGIYDAKILILKNNFKLSEPFCKKFGLIIFLRPKEFKRRFSFFYQEDPIYSNLHIDIIDYSELYFFSSKENCIAEVRQGFPEKLSIDQFCVIDEKLIKDFDSVHNLDKIYEEELPNFSKEIGWQ
ncbi:MAG: hypothetical protein LBJ32_02570 [Oscillospiraceae bacterium]|jgi:hypothetical protein|nr:hypothetical protein [Oscillospiraceae bacterium]